MNRHIFTFLITFLSITGYAQPDSSLQVRLDIFFRLNHLKEIDRVLDYTYPKLFTIVPRDQMREIMSSTFDNEEMTVEMDSLQVLKFHPMIVTTEGSFLQLDYSMIMRMQFKETEADSTDDPEKTDQLISVLSGKYGEGNARYDAGKKQIVILVKSPLLAIKDRLSPQWTFINFKKDDKLTPMLLSKDILDKLSSQQ